MKFFPDAKHFVLTLPQSEQRLQETLAHFQTEGVETPVPFLGIDSRLCGLWTHYTYRLDNPDEHYRVSGKAIGIFLSHYMLWGALAYGNHVADTFVIYEDDARFVPGWSERLEKAFMRIPSDWDILFPGSCCCAGRNPDPLGDGVFRAVSVQCLHCYVVKTPALLKLLQLCQRVWTKLDIAITLDALPHLKGFVFLPRLVTQYNTLIPP